MPKLIDFKFGDFRDWFIPEKNKSNHTKKYLLLIQIKKNKCYKIEVPGQVSSFRLLLPNTVDEVRKAAFSFEDNLIIYREIHMIPQLDKYLTTVYISKTKDNQSIKIRSWSDKQWKNATRFGYEIDRLQTWKRGENLMRKLVFVLMLFGFLYFSSTAIAIDIGSHYHVTGCHNGKLILPIINLWSDSDGGVEGASIVGRVSGGSKKDLGLQCQGSIIKVLDIHGEYIKVQSINGKVGWVASGFIGEKVK